MTYGEAVDVDARVHVNKATKGASKVFVILVLAMASKWISL